MLIMDGLMQVNQYGLIKFSVVAVNHQSSPALEGHPLELSVVITMHWLVSCVKVGGNKISIIIQFPTASGPSCTNNALRMIRSQNWTPFNGRGRIEICSNGQWGTICDDGWNLNDVKVACFQLGFSKNSK